VCVVVSGPVGKRGRLAIIIMFLFIKFLSHEVQAGTYAMAMSICLSVCLSPETCTKNAVFSKTKQFRAMVCIDDPHEVLMGFSKNSFLDPYDDLERQQTSLRAPQNNFSYELQQPP